LFYTYGMLYSLTGAVISKGDNFLVLEAAGIGFKVHTNQRTLDTLREGASAKLFSHLQVKEDSMDLFGFLAEEELHFFELLISVSGVGPRSALSILQISDLTSLSAAIQEGRPDVLTRASGIGRKTAERIIVELRTKVQVGKSADIVKKMETDADLAEVLINLGYSREQARAALGKVDEKVVGLEERLKAALRILGRGN